MNYIPPQQTTEQKILDILNKVEIEGKIKFEVNNQDIFDRYEHSKTLSQDLYKLEELRINNCQTEGSLSAINLIKTSYQNFQIPNSQEISIFEFDLYLSTIIDKEKEYYSYLRNYIRPSSCEEIIGGTIEDKYLKLGVCFWAGYDSVLQEIFKEIRNI